MKPFPLGHPFERCHFKGPAMPSVSPPPTAAGPADSSVIAAEDAARLAAANRYGYDQTVLGGRKKAAQSSDPATILQGTGTTMGA